MEAPSFCWWGGGRGSEDVRDEDRCAVGGDVVDWVSSMRRTDPLWSSVTKMASTEEDGTSASGTDCWVFMIQMCIGYSWSWGTGIYIYLSRTWCVLIVEKISNFEKKNRSPLFRFSTCFATHPTVPTGAKNPVVIDPLENCKLGWLAAS